MTAEVIMYTTAVCPYCIRAERLLEAKGVTALKKIRVDLDPEQRMTMMQRPAAAPCRKSISATPTSAVSMIVCARSSGRPVPLVKWLMPQIQRAPGGKPLNHNGFDTIALAFDLSCF
jgi:glutaredoxin